MKGAVRGGAAIGVALLLVSFSGAARAQSDDEDYTVRDEDLARYKRLNEHEGTYLRFLVGSGFGRGLRFNNPFRLETQLGESPESVSLTAPYHDIQLAVAGGEPDGLQHGLAVHFSISLEGVAQQTLSWSYLLLRRSGSWLGYGRIGNVALTAPDANLGGELALGGAYFLTGGAGLTAELVGNLFYGAGTYDVSVTTVPTLSFTGGIIIDYEVLP